MKKNNTNERPAAKGVLSSKLYLYLTEFFAGMSVMAVELGASRLLAPYFSSSQIVWTIIIGTIMIAMALGNYFGGKSADKDPDPDKLYKRVLFGGVDSGYTLFRQDGHTGRFCASGSNGQHEFPDMGGVSGLYDSFRVPAVSAGHCHSVTGKIHH